jgi:phospholipid transport system transporter-binding protein
MLSQQSAGRYCVTTELTFATVAALRPLGLAALAQVPVGSVTIELAGVTQADSAGLALLVDWIAAARSCGAQLRYEGISPALRALARLSDVEDLVAPQGA